MMQRTVFVGIFCAVLGVGTCLPPICVLECMQKWLTCEIHCRKSVEDAKPVAVKTCSKDCATARRTCLDPCTIFADLKKAMVKTHEKLKRYDLKSHKSQEIAAQTIKEEISKHKKPKPVPVVPPPIFPTTTPKLRKQAPGTAIPRKDKTTHSTTAVKRARLVIESPKSSHTVKKVQIQPPTPKTNNMEKRVQIQPPTMKTKNNDKKIQIPPPPPPVVKPIPETPVVKPIPETPTVKPDITTNAAKTVLDKAETSQTTSENSSSSAKKESTKPVV